MNEGKSLFALPLEDLLSTDQFCGMGYALCFRCLQPASSRTLRARTTQGSNGLLTASSLVVGLPTARLEQRDFNCQSCLILGAGTSGPGPCYGCSVMLPRTRSRTVPPCGIEP